MSLPGNVLTSASQELYVLPADQIPENMTHFRTAKGTEKMPGYGDVAIFLFHATDKDKQVVKLQYTHLRLPDRLVQPIVCS